MSPDDLANFMADLGAAGLSFVYTPAGLAAGAANDFGLFDFYYNALDAIYESTGIYVIPPGLYPFPLLIPTEF